MQQVSAQLTRIGREDSFQIMNVRKGGPLGQSRTRIHRSRHRVGVLVSRTVDPLHRFALFQAAVTLPPATEHIKVLQRHPHRIKPKVTPGAGLIPRV